MYSLYSALIYSIYLFVHLFSLWNKKVKCWMKGQQTTQKFIHHFVTLPPDTSPLYWFHCASLGEFEQARPLLEEIKKRNPSIRILLTFFSPSGYEVHKNYPLATYVLYLPLDTPLFLLPFIDAFKPTVLFLAKYDFWPNLISLLYKRKVPILAFSTVFRPTQVYFQWYGIFFRKTLKKVTFLFAQDKKTVDLLTKKGFTQTALAGDTRLDRVIQIASNPKKFPNLTKDTTRFFVAGSIWEKDFRLIQPLIHQFPSLHFILVPHEIKEAQIQKWENELSHLTVMKWSDWHTKKEIILPKILLIDTVGILSSLYSVASFAYIGGAWDKGLHNTLEAAVYGIPIFFGAKKHHSFPEANELIALGAAFSVHDSTELKYNLIQLLNSDERYKKAAVTAQKYIYEKAGATDKILKLIEDMALIP
ncbi:MAG: 3-deoxy-D-manno-octulosonic acid transferase [Spirosomataceae bacterium]